MENKQLLEKVMVDLLRDPECPIYQYKDSQLMHICQQIQLHDYTNVKDDRFHKRFAQLFIQHLSSQNELQSIIDKAKVKRQDTKLKSKEFSNYQNKPEIQIKQQDKQNACYEQATIEQNKQKRNCNKNNALTFQISEIMSIEDDIYKAPQVDSSISITPAPKTTNFSFNNNNAFSFQQLETKKLKAQTPKIAKSTTTPVQQNRQQKDHKKQHQNHHLDPIPKKKVDIKLDQPLSIQFDQNIYKEKSVKHIQNLKESKEREIRERELAFEIAQNDKRNFFNTFRGNFCASDNNDKKKSKAVIDTSSDEIVIRLSDAEIPSEPQNAGGKSTPSKLQLKQLQKQQKTNEKEQGEIEQQDNKKKTLEDCKQQEKNLKQLEKKMKEPERCPELQNKRESVLKMITNLSQNQEDIIELTPQKPQITQTQKMSMKMVQPLIQSHLQPTVNQFQSEISSVQPKLDRILPPMIYQLPSLGQSYQMQNWPIQQVNQMTQNSFIPKDDICNGNLMQKKNSQNIIRIPKNFSSTLNNQQDNPNDIVNKELEPTPQKPEIATENLKPEKQQKKIEKEQNKQVATLQLKNISHYCYYCGQISIVIRLIEVSDGANICPSCLLERINPFQKIVNKLFQLEYKYQGKNQSRTSIDFNITHEYLLNQSFQLEVRCVMMNKYGLADLTFPNSCQLLINGVGFKDIRPLIDKSCLKKRKDNAIILNLQEFVKTYGVQRKYTFTCIEIVPDSKMRQDSLGQIYYFGLFIVQYQSVLQVIDSIKNSTTTSQIEMDNCKNEIKIDKSKVSFICQFSLELIQIPAKGEFCQHQQCFSLNNYLEMMLKAEHRKWVCPICKKVCLSLIVDKNQLQILDRIRQLELNVEQITLDQDGTIDKDDPLSSIIKDENITKYQDVLQIGHCEIQKKVNIADEEDEIIREQPKQGKNEYQAIVID